MGGVIPLSGDASERPPVRPPTASASVAGVTRTFARRALISAAALLALGAAVAETPGEILKRALAAKPCPAAGRAMPKGGAMVARGGLEPPTLRL